MDIGLNSHFDVELDHRHDLPLVEGRAAFEQALRIHLTDYFSGLVGDVNEQAVKSLLGVEARRVAKDMDALDTVTSIVIEPSAEFPNTMDVTVSYDMADGVSFSLSE